MKRWTSVSAFNEEARWQKLSERLTQLGVANEYIKWTGPTTGFDNIDALDEFDHVRLSSRIGPGLVKKLKVQSTWITMLGVVDGMVKTSQSWWPLCALYESFGQILIGMGQELDNRGSVLIAGAGGVARAAIAALFKAGFTRFLLTNFVPDEADEMIRDVRSKFFGLTIEWVPMDKVVLLPGDSSVLVNGTPDIPENKLLLELSYLNFLRRPGVLFDLNRGKPSVLVTEAKDARVKVVRGIEFASRTDVLWSKWAFQTDLDLASYKGELASTLEGG
ncbi:MAG: hypothetical protein AB7G93_06615 [Bdellovibrionales bacterium]